MTYKARPGVTLIKVCGTFLLAPTRAASKECPHVMRLSTLGWMLWQLLMKGRDQQGLYLVYSAFSGRTDKDVEQDVAEFVTSLCDNGFLIEVPDEDDDNDGD